MSGSSVHFVTLVRIRGSVFLERARLSLVVVALFVAGYFGLGRTLNSSHGHQLTTALDERIPFVASWIWVYLWVFPCAFVPLFVVKCPRLFRLTAIAYAIAIIISIVSFTAFPVTAAKLREGQAGLDVSRVSGWAVSCLYCLDPPWNLFPSLHVAITALAAFSAWKAHKIYGKALVASVGLVAISTCMIKQHFLLDVAGGLTLAAFVGNVFLKPYRPEKGVCPAYSWWGAAMYLMFVVAIYAGFFIAFICCS
jgi:membrane-associated phospholipid phosphatase